MKRIIVSGRSGSGKSVCLRLLEDIGFYCVDNLPISLLPALEAQMVHQHENLAVSIDSRNLSVNYNRYKEILDLLKQPQHAWEIIYFDANNSTLIKRFSETKRKHPLTNTNLNITLKEALAHEKQLLEPIADKADLIIDTRNLNTNQLRKELTERILKRPQDKLSILIQSFGYKYGLPLDADFIFDARTLPNPYWVPELRDFTGRCPPVIEFLNTKLHAKKMLSELRRFLRIWLPHFEKDSRCYLTIAIGCTGGKHRSVFLTEQLTKLFINSDYHIQLRHRDLQKHQAKKPVATT